MLDKRNDALRQLAVDLAYLRKTKEELIRENEIMKTKLSRMQNVDEIHIEIDTLSTTPHGVQTLKNRYAKMMDRFAKEKERNEQYENEFFKKL
jgi:hypothetical protein